MPLAPTIEPTVELPTPHNGQLIVLSEARRFNVLAMGRRWGKSTFGIDLVTHPLVKGFDVAWYAPTNKALGAMWELAKKTFRPITRRTQEQDHRIETISGGACEMWSLQDKKTADSGRGRKYKRAVIDEAAHVPVLEYAWQNVIRPALTDYAGDGWFCSSPAGLNYFKTLWDRGQDPLRPNWMSWQMPSVTNPFLPPGEIEEAREDLTELAFAQEYLAQFVTWEGAVFRRILDAVKADLPDHPQPDHSYIIGVDWGKQRDYTVFAVIDPATGQLVELDRSRGHEYSLQRARLAALRDRWTYRSGNPPVIRRQPSVIAEINAMGDPIIEQLRKDGIPVTAFQTTNASKSEIVEALALAFERGDISIPNNPVLLGELQQFQGVKLASGLMRYEAPSGQHDDTVIALAIAWYAARKDITRQRPVTVQQLTRESPWHIGREDYGEQRW